MKKTTSIKWTAEQLEALDTCQRIHKHAEEFYQYLSEIYHQNSEIAKIWGLLAIDKCNHSDTYKMAYRLKGEGIKEINIMPEMADNILAKMKSIPKLDRNNPPSIVDTLKFTIKMEEILKNVHFSQVVKFLRERNSALMASSLKSSSTILHLMTEEYLNLTVVQHDSFEDFQMDTGPAT